MQINILGHTIHWNHPSGWRFLGAGRSLSGSIGVDAPFIFANAGISLGGAVWEIDVDNTERTTAGQIISQGHFLPNWYRKYRFKVAGVTVGLGGGLGPSAIVNASVGRGEIDDPAGGIGAILRQVGAPPGDAYEAGDPYGFLGVGLQTTGSVSVSNVMGATASVGALQMGSNIVDKLRGNPSWLVDNLAHLGSLLAGHLAFQYSGFHWGRGGDTFQIGEISGSIELELQMCFIAIIDLFIVQPGTNHTFYVRSWKLDDNNEPVVYRRDHGYPREWTPRVGNSGKA